MLPVLIKNHSTQLITDDWNVVNHLLIAIKLLKEQFNSYEEYVEECNQYSIIHYNKEVYNDYVYKF